MSEFRKFESIQRLGRQYGYTNGVCYLFSKLDGCNGSASANINADTIDTFSRNGPIEYINDDIRIGNYIESRPALKKFILDNPQYTIYGEFMRRQEIRYYDKDAWGCFFVFDVYDSTTGRYVHYDVYSKWFDELGIEYIPVIAVISNPTVEQIAEHFTNADFCLKDGGGVCEGIVIKNYNYVRRDGVQKWERLITSEFRKAKGNKPMDMRSIETRIIDKYCTEAQISKNYHKTMDKLGVMSENTIIQIYHRVYHDVVNEDIWQVIVDHKDPTINFMLLKKLIEKEVRLWIEQRKEGN